MEKKVIKAGLLVMLSLNLSLAQPFFPVGGGTNQGIYSLFADSVQNLLYVGGPFSFAGNLQCKTIAKWNGITWDSLPNNLSGDVRGINLLNNELYIEGYGGMFDTSLGQWVGGPLRLNSATNSWMSFSSGASGLWNIVKHNNYLLFIGDFDSIGGISSSKIARYDGTNWYAFPPLDTNVGGWTIINAMFYNGDLYVGGNFESQAGANMLDIAKWDGTQWLPVGNGLSGANTSVWSFATYQGKLIVGGYFNTSWGDPGNNIAAWDGTAWTQLGMGVDNEVQSLCVYNNELWAGGIFNNAGGSPAKSLAKWDGTSWHSLGISLNGAVTSMAVLGNDLYIAGGFNTLNGDTVNYIIRYNYLTGFEDLSLPKSKLEINPNPSNGNFSFTSLFYPIESIRLFDLSGSIVFSKDKILSNSYQCKLKVPDGVYIAEVIMNGAVYRNKIVILH